MRALLEKVEFAELDETNGVPRSEVASVGSSVDEDGRLAALADGSLAAKFRYWRGASGRRYVFSVHPQRSCPAYDHAILLAARKDESGRRRIAFVADTGGLPELVLAQAIRVVGDSAAELQMHLLAGSPSARAQIIADLCVAP
jgi:hypothetical protein